MPRRTPSTNTDAARQRRRRNPRSAPRRPVGPGYTHPTRLGTGARTVIARGRKVHDQVGHAALVQLVLRRHRVARPHQLRLAKVALLRFPQIVTTRDGTAPCSAHHSSRVWGAPNSHAPLTAGEARRPAQRAPWCSACGGTPTTARAGTAFITRAPAPHARQRGPSEPDCSGAPCAARARSSLANRPACLGPWTGCA